MRLDVKSTGASSVAQFKSDQSAGSLYVRDNTGNGVVVTGSTTYGHQLMGEGVYPFLFGTNGTERMRIDSSGNVGVGITATPFAKLQVVGTVATSQFLVGKVQQQAGLFLASDADPTNFNWQIASQRNVPGLEITPSTAVGGTTFSNPAIVIRTTGQVGIGPGVGATMPNVNYMLTVNGTIAAKEVLVESNVWADYILQPGYRPAPLRDVAAYIREHHHLPEMPSEAEVREKGVSVGEMQVKLLAKIEELTLHLIQADEKARELQERILGLETATLGQAESSDETRARGKN